MNKTSKHKNSTRTIKSSRNLTTRQAEIISTRTPQNNGKKLQIKKTADMQKFKSIPTITYRDVEVASIPTQNLIYQSYVGHPLQTVFTIQQSQPRLLYSVSDRNNYSASKVSLHSKIQRSSKKTMVTSKNKSNYTLRTHRKSDNFQNLYQRAKTVLESYRAREQEWKKQRTHLIRQLDKYKQRSKKRKNSTTISNNKKNKN